MGSRTTIRRGAVYACAAVLVGVTACSGTTTSESTAAPPSALGSTPAAPHPAVPENVATGTVAARLPVCAGAMIPSDTNPIHHATLRVTAADGSVRLIRVSAHLRPDLVSIRLPVGSYRIHDTVVGFHLPDSHVVVRLDRTSHVDLGFVACY